MGRCTVKQYLEDYIKTPTLLKITYMGEEFLFHAHVMGIDREDNEWYTEGTKVEQIAGEWQNVGWFKLPTEKLDAVPQAGLSIPELSPDYEPVAAKARYRRIGFAQR